MEVVCDSVRVRFAAEGVATPVFFLAEGTGISAEALGNAILQQFPGVEFDRRRFSFIDTPQRAREVVAQMDAALTATGRTPLVFTTCAVEAIRAEVARTRCVVVDLFGAHLSAVERALHATAARTAGSAHGLGDLRQYDNRMRAVEYAMEHDDGQSVRDLQLADLILVAPSRCGKTPTSMYLALQHGLFVANYPLVEEDLDSDRLPEPIRDRRDRCFGILSTPARLSEVRNKRRPESRYASLEQCHYELRGAEALFVRHDIPWVNSTAMSVEEMSTVIIARLDLHPTQ